MKSATRSTVIVIIALFAVLALSAVAFSATHKTLPVKGSGGTLGKTLNVTNLDEDNKVRMTVVNRHGDKESIVVQAGDVILALRFTGSLPEG